jgi:predicted nucleic acid-binding protein
MKFGGFLFKLIYMNILEKANEIVNLRSEEKEREYGPFIEGMERSAKILSGMTGKEIDTSFMYKALIALKLSRESYNHKEDNLLDAVAYLGSLNNYYNEK